MVYEYDDDFRQANDVDEEAGSDETESIMDAASQREAIRNLSAASDSTLPNDISPEPPERPEPPKEISDQDYKDLADQIKKSGQIPQRLKDALDRGIGGSPAIDLKKLNDLLKPQMQLILQPMPTGMRLELVKGGKVIDAEISKTQAAREAARRMLEPAMPGGRGLPNPFLPLPVPPVPNDGTPPATQPPQRGPVPGARPEAVPSRPGAQPPRDVSPEPPAVPRLLPPANRRDSSSPFLPYVPADRSRQDQEHGDRKQS